MMERKIREENGNQPLSAKFKIQNGEHIKCKNHNGKVMLKYEFIWCLKIKLCLNCEVQLKFVLKNPFVRFRV